MDLERRLRSALSARADSVRASDDAWLVLQGRAENRQRTIVRRRTLVAAVSALAIAFVGIGFAAKAFLHPADTPMQAVGRTPGSAGGMGGATGAGLDEVIMRMRAGDTGPTALLITRDDVQRGILGSHCWRQRPHLEIVCVDSILRLPEPYVELPRGALLRIEGDATDVDGFLAKPKGDPESPTDLERLERLPLADADARLDVAPGKYALALTGNWTGKGEAIFYLAIRIVPVEPGAWVTPQRVLPPPPCPSEIQDEGGATLAPTFGPPGTTVTITGRLGLYRRDGTYSPSDKNARVGIWWNGDPAEPYAVLRKDIEPSPLGAGEVVFLAQQRVAYPCGFFRLQFQVPETQAGTYYVIAVSFENGGGGSLRPMTFRVVAPRPPVSGGPGASPSPTTSLSGGPGASPSPTRG